MPRPEGYLRLAEVARLAMAWSDILAVTDENRSREAGAPVSCGKGCAACCREFIPLSPAEAFFLAELLEGGPEDWRAARRERFHAAEAAWVAGRPADPDAYFRLGLSCPFLDDESCTVHAMRPLACREHLVTSLPEHCASFPDFSIRVLSLRHRVGEALFLVSAELLARPPERIPLILAPEWAREHAPDGRRRWEGEKVAEALAHHVFSR